MRSRLALALLFCAASAFAAGPVKVVRGGSFGSFQSSFGNVVGQTVRSQAFVVKGSLTTALRGVDLESEQSLTAFAPVIAALAAKNIDEAALTALEEPRRLELVAAALQEASNLALQKANGHLSANFNKVEDPAALSAAVAEMNDLKTSFRHYLPAQTLKLLEVSHQAASKRLGVLLAQMTEDSVRRIAAQVMGNLETDAETLKAIQAFAAERGSRSDTPARQEARRLVREFFTGDGDVGPLTDLVRKNPADEGVQRIVVQAVGFRLRQSSWDSRRAKQLSGALRAIAEITNLDNTRSLVIQELGRLVSRQAFRKFAEGFDKDVERISGIAVESGSRRMHQEALDLLGSLKNPALQPIIDRERRYVAFSLKALDRKIPPMENRETRVIDAFNAQQNRRGNWAFFLIMAAWIGLSFLFMTLGASGVTGQWAYYVAASIFGAPFLVAAFNFIRYGGFPG